MKYTSLLCLLIFLSYVNDQTAIGKHVNNDNHKLNPCPVAKQSDIFPIHGLLLKINEEPILRKKLGISFKPDRQKFKEYSKKGAQTPQLFKSYWEKRDVARVTNSVLCQHIYNSLEENDKNRKRENIREAFYKVKNSYLIIFTPEEVKGTGYKKYPSPVLMDNQFKIVTKIVI